MEIEILQCHTVVEVDVLDGVAVASEGSELCEVWQLYLGNVVVRAVECNEVGTRLQSGEVGYALARAVYHRDVVRLSYRYFAITVVVIVVYKIGLQCHIGNGDTAIVVVDVGSIVLGDIDSTLLRIVLNPQLNHSRIVRAVEGGERGSCANIQ